MSTPRPVRAYDRAAAAYALFDCRGAMLVQHEGRAFVGLVELFLHAPGAAPVAPLAAPSEPPWAKSGMPPALPPLGGIAATPLPTPAPPPLPPPAAAAAAARLPPPPEATSLAPHASPCSSSSSSSAGGGTGAAVSPGAAAAAGPSFDAAREEAEPDLRSLVVGAMGSDCRPCGGGGGGGAKRPPDPFGGVPLDVTEQLIAMSSPPKRFCLPNGRPLQLFATDHFSVVPPPPPSPGGAGDGVSAGSDRPGVCRKPSIASEGTLEEISSLWFDIGYELEAGSAECAVADAEMEEEAGAGDAGASHFLGPAPESGGEGGGSSALVKLAGAFMATLAVSSMASMARSAKR